MTLVNYYRVQEIYGRSSSIAFMSVKVGDYYKFSIPVGAVRRCAAYIKCENLRTKNISELSFNQIERVLKNFNLKEMINEKMCNDIEDRKYPVTIGFYGME